MNIGSEGTPTWRCINPRSSHVLYGDSDYGMLTNAWLNINDRFLKVISSGFVKYEDVITSSLKAAMDDMSSYANTTAFDAVWVPQDTAKMRGDPTNDEIDFIGIRDNTNDAISFDVLGAAISDTLWQCRFRMEIDTLTNPGSSDIVLAIGMSDLPSSTSGSTNQDFIGITLVRTSGGSSVIQITDTNGANPTASSDATFTKTLAVGTYYVKITRLSATSYKVDLYSNPGYTDLYETKTGTCVGTTASLRYFCIKNAVTAGAANGTITGRIKDLELFSGFLV
ncbi:hypothetical protein YTPLAS73_09100 [Nitrosarchaeum sp.]|nr:hypothetical protein YTPLAS73_09100 [Nitrosarchaeum sp.]